VAGQEVLELAVAELVTEARDPDQARRLGPVQETGRAVGQAAAAQKQSGRQVVAALGAEDRRRRAGLGDSGGDRGDQAAAGEQQQAEADPAADDDPSEQAVDQIHDQIVVDRFARAGAHSSAGSCTGC
jgi:hypothetical protein